MANNPKGINKLSGITIELNGNEHGNHIYDYVWGTTGAIKNNSNTGNTEYVNDSIYTNRTTNESPGTKNSIEWSYTDAEKLGVYG